MLWQVLQKIGLEAKMKGKVRRKIHRSAPAKIARKAPRLIMHSILYMIRVFMQTPKGSDSSS